MSKLKTRDFAPGGDGPFAGDGADLSSLSQLGAGLLSVNPTDMDGEATLVA